MKKLMLSLVCAAVAAASRGALPLYEPFQYTAPNPLIGQTHPMGYTWLGAGAAGAQQPTIQADNLNYPGLDLPILERVLIRAGNGQSAVLPFASVAVGAPGGDHQDYPITAGLVVYSLLLRVTDASGLGTAGNAFAALASYVSPGAVLATPPSGYVRALLRADAGGGGYNIGLQKSTATAAVWHPAVFTTTDTVLIVGVYEFYAGANNDVAKMWINPSHTTYCVGPSVPDLASTGGTDAADLGSFTYYQRPAPDAPARLLTDELRLGQSWKSVLPRGVDFGDADADYRVTESENGARHILIPGVWLGSTVDGECDGTESSGADADDTTDDDDEDGVTWSGMFWRGLAKSIEVTASIDGMLDLWIDWDQDGVWSSTEQVFDDEPLKAGANALSVPVPVAAPLGQTYARFRFSLAGVAGPVGLAANGEVEDYSIGIAPNIDVHVAPAGDAAIHINEGETYSLALRVANNGSNTASDVSLTVSLPEHIEVQSISSSLGVCQATQGGVTCRLASLDPGQEDAVIIALTALADDLPGDDYFSLGEVTVAVMPAEPDLNLANNQIVLPVAVFFGRDWGDAPEGYPVTNVENGARHRSTWLNSIRLGTQWDRESDGTHSPAADYDDTTGAVPDDEDGVNFIATTGTMTVEVTVTGDGYLNAWMDFDRNLSWAGAGEQILTDVLLTTGTYTYNITVPSSTTAGQLVSRWRYSQNPGLPFDGPGGRGEVEDYVTDWEPEASDELDYGDAPETLIIGGGGIAVVTGFPVTNIRDGARHLKSNLMLGLNWDSEPDGQPSADALLDDTTGVIDDEDGVSLPAGGFVYGTVVNITVWVAGGPGALDAWVDWNGNYAWDDPPERIATGLAVAPGPNIIAVAVPSGIPSGDRYARFRLSSTSTPLAPLAQNGLASDGEVEDYMVYVLGDVNDNNDDGPNPNPVYFAGLEHAGQGGAALRASAAGLEVSNLGASGEDGVRINLGRSQGWRGTVVHGPEPLANNSTVYSINIVGFKDSQRAQSLAIMRVERQGRGLSLAADFRALGASQYMAQFYDVQGGQIGSPIPREAMQAVSIIPDCPEGYAPDCEWFTYTDNEGQVHIGALICHGCFRLPDGTEGGPIDEPILCVLTPAAGAAPVEFISAVEIHHVSLTNPTTLMIESESVLQFGLWHRLLGGAVMGAEVMAHTDGGPVLPIGRMGPSGQDGIETIVGGGEYIGELPAGNLLRHRVEMEFGEDAAGAFTLPGLGKFTATGRIQGSSSTFETLSELSLIRQDSGAAGLIAGADGLGATQIRVDVYHGEELAGSVTLPTGMLGTLSDSRFSAVSIVDGADLVMWLVQLDSPAVFTPSTGAPLAGDRLLITTLDARAVIEGLRSLIVRGTGEESLLIGKVLTPKLRHPVMAVPRPLAGGRLELNFTSEPGVVYYLEISHSLKPLSWTYAATRIGAAGALTSRFLVMPEGPASYYRIRAW